jgi:hypothetical protein
LKAGSRDILRVFVLLAFGGSVALAHAPVPGAWVAICGSDGVVRRMPFPAPTAPKDDRNNGFSGCHVALPCERGRQSPASPQTA